MFQLSPVVSRVFIALSAAAGVACSTIPRADTPPPHAVPVDLEPLAPAVDCSAADGLHHLRGVVKGSSQEEHPVAPSMTRALRQLAHCNVTGDVGLRDTMATFLVARASVEEAEALRTRLGADAAAQALVETWGAALHQQRTGDIVSSAVTYAVEDLVLHALVGLAPELSEAAARTVSRDLEALRRQRLPMSVVGDLAAADDYPGWRGAFVAASCRSLSGGRAAEMDAAFVAGDVEELSEVEAWANTGWRAWHPGRHCTSGQAGILADHVETWNALEDQHELMRRELLDAR